MRTIKTYSKGRPFIMRFSGAGHVKSIPTVRSCQMWWLFGSCLLRKEQEKWHV